MAASSEARVMRSSNKNCLQFYKDSPACIPRDISSYTYSMFVAKHKELESSTERVNPIKAASEFYYLNQLVHRIEQKIGQSLPLGDYRPIVESYYDVVHRESQRMFLYMLFITFRECRHGNASPEIKAGTKLRKAMDIAINSSGDTLKGMGKLEDNTPIGSMIDAIADYYLKSNAFGGSFGGQPWSMIAKTLSQFVHGKMSAEVFYDTCFSLEHNTGTIFNKPALYSDPNKEHLQTLLNHQANGHVVTHITNNPYWWQGYKDLPQNVVSELGGNAPPPEGKIAPTSPIKEKTPWGMKGEEVRIIPSVSVKIL